MKRNQCVFIFLFPLLIACKTAKKEITPAPFVSSQEAVLLNQAVYKSPLNDSLSSYAPAFETVFLPDAVNGNFAFIAKKKNSGQYALVIRGSVIEFSNEGFQNFIVQDFNIFTMKPWQYADTVQDAYISNGTWTGLQNLLQLRDKESGLSIKEFIEQKIAKGSSLIVTGHSLGGNLAYPLTGYLQSALSPALGIRLQLITFGAPAAGNAAFVRDMEEKFPDAERYVIDKDIAPVFPDIDKISSLAKIMGLDSVMQLHKLNIPGINQLKTSDILTVAGDILKATNVVNEKNRYVQSEKHLRLLTAPLVTAPENTLTAEALFNRAYEFHRVDMYAALLGATARR